LLRTLKSRAFNKRWKTAPGENTCVRNDCRTVARRRKEIIDKVSVLVCVCVCVRAYMLHMSLQCFECVVIIVVFVIDNNSLFRVLIM
jgi:hypothetical protein